MRYREVVEVYEEIAKTASRLQITAHMVELLRRTPAGVVDKVIYLTQGTLYPDFVGMELGLAEKLVVKALALAANMSEGHVQKVWLEKGDMGLVGEEVLRERHQKSLYSEPLTVEKVYGNLEGIARASGQGSQETKMRLLADLMNDAEPLEAKYILRTVIGKMRLGLADMTILDALAQAYGTKELRPAVERAYNLCSDLGKVGRVLAERGPEGLEEIHLGVGVPIRSMLCERLPSLEEILEKLHRCAFEYKYDGLRVQCHIAREGIKLYSRRLENITDQFPDLTAALRTHFKGESGIVEGEAVPVDPTGAYLPFQTVSQRRGRKYDLERMQQEVPVHLLLFDCLGFDGESLLDRTYTERRARLETAIDPGGLVWVATNKVTDDLKEADYFFTTALAEGCEGLVAKALDSRYEAGARGWQWIKYKREYKAEMSDTADLVVVGALAGRGRRAGTYGALLMAAYDEPAGRFKTVTKMGSGFDDETLFDLPNRFRPLLLPHRHPMVDSEIEADFWFEPKVVMEVRGAEITLSPTHTAAWGQVKEGAGLAIRFPRFTGRWREDKGPEDATTSKEILEMYRNQLRKVSE